MGVGASEGHNLDDYDEVENPLVIVVEGNPDEMYMISEELAKHDLRVLGYEDVSKASARMEKDTAALIIVDLKLPGEGGYSILRSLRADGEGSSIPAIAIVSGEGDKDAAGGTADVFLMRPFDRDSLVKAVKSLLKRHIV